MSTDGELQANGTHARVDAVDADGKRLVLLRRVWRKVLRKHRVFRDSDAEAIAAALASATAFRASSPTRRRLVATDPTRTTKWVVAVVDYGDDPARIVTIYPQSRDPKETDRL